MADLELDKIRTDGGTQPRAGLDQQVIKEYADDMRAGARFPSVTVFHDGKSYWLSSGFHRVAAANQNGDLTIDADIRQGTHRNAVFHSVGVNAEHGLQRSPADKRRAVETLLRDPEWGQWSDNAIAKACKVDHKTVGRLRGILGIPKIKNFTNKGEVDPDQRKAERSGKTYAINTTNIGNRATSGSASDPILHWQEDEVDSQLDPQTIKVVSEVEEESTAVVPQPTSTEVSRERSSNGEAGFDSDWEETGNLPGEAKLDVEPLLQIGDRVKSVYLDRFGTVIKVHGGLVSTQWEDGFTSTERLDDLQLVPSDKSESQSELDKTTSESSPGQQLPPEAELLEQSSNFSGIKELPKPSETRVRFSLSWFGNEVEVEGVLVAVLIKWEYQGRTGETQVPIEKVLKVLR